MEISDATGALMWALIFAAAAVWIGLMLAFTYRSHRRPRPQDTVMDDAGYRRPQLTAR